MPYIAFCRSELAREKRQR